MDLRASASTVIPVYRSKDCLEELVIRAKAAFVSSGHKCEIVLVNDCSPDGSWDKIRELAAVNDEIVGLNLRRNVGQDNAIMAGLSVASGEIIVIMDDDLQHDPRDAEKLIRQVEAGYDVCYGRFPKKKQAVWKNVGSWFNDKVANIVIGKSSGIYLSPYKAIAAPVVREMTKYDGPFPYVDGLIFRVTGNITQVDVDHHERFAGAGNYNLRRSIGVWLKVATGFSLRPLRIATYLGFAFSGMGLLFAAAVIIRKLLINPSAPLGWASTMVTVLVLGGLQLGCLGVVGEYLGRAFLLLNRQPQYVVKERVGRAPREEADRGPEDGR